MSDGQSKGFASHRKVTPEERNWLTKHGLSSAWVSPSAEDFKAAFFTAVEGDAEIRVYIIGQDWEVCVEIDGMCYYENGMTPEQVLVSMHARIERLSCAANAYRSSLSKIMADKLEDTYSG